MAKNQVTARVAERTHAADLVARLNLPEFRKRARLSEAEMAILDEISTGKYVRNAASILKAIEFRAGYAYGKPKEPVEHSGTIRVELLEDADGAR